MFDDLDPDSDDFEKTLKQMFEIIKKSFGSDLPLADQNVSLEDFTSLDDMKSLMFLLRNSPEAEKFQSVFNDLLGGNNVSAMDQNDDFESRVQIEENKEDSSLIVRIKLPGIKKENIRLTLSKDFMTLILKFKIFTFKEYFRREILLAYPVNPTTIQAKMDRGILNIVLDKKKSEN